MANLLPRLSSLGVALLLAACSRDEGPDPAETPSDSDAPHLLLITLDTTRHDLFTFAGARSSCGPQLDRLATESIVCTHCYAVAPMTLPSHASIHTGLYPFAHGVHDNSAFQLSEEGVTLAEALSVAGYRTEAFVASTVLHRQSGLAQGFDRYHDLDFGRKANLAQDAERDATSVTDQALARLAIDDDRPRFFWVHYFDPHAPYRAPGTPPGTPRILAYRAEVQAMDAQIGRLLDAFRARDDWANTAVVVTADHGEGLSRGLELTHGFLVEDHTMRVPLLIRTPGGETHGTLSSPTSGVDAFATLWALSGDEVPDAVHGHDLVEAFEQHHDGSAASEPDRAVYIESHHPLYQLRWAPLTGIVTSKWRFVEGARDELSSTASAGERAHVVDDPATAAALRDRLHHMIEHSPTTLATERASLSPAQLARLRTLGYLASAGVETTELDPRTLPDPRDVYPDFLAYESAVDLGSQGRYAEAAQGLQSLVERYPKNASFRDSYGRCLLGAGRISDGMEQLRLALEHDPERINCWFSLGRAHRMRKEWRTPNVASSEHWSCSAGTFRRCCCREMSTTPSARAENSC